MSNASQYYKKKKKVRSLTVNVCLSTNPLIIDLNIYHNVPINC